MTKLPSGLGSVSRRALRRMAAVLAAAALALAAVAGTAAPARASDDLVRFLFAATAVAILLRAVDDRHRPVHHGGRVLPASCLETVGLHGRAFDLFNSACLQRAGYRHLPAHCEVELRTVHGRRSGFEASCMQAAGYSIGGRPLPPQVVHPRPPHRFPDTAGHLPAECELHYRDGRRRALGYDRQCLRDAGFRRLPRHCTLPVQGGGSILDAQCLWDAGYRRAWR